MSLAEHLTELRNRVVLAGLGILVGAVAGWIFYPYIFELLQRPIAAMQEAGIPAELNFAELLAAFDVKVRLSFTAGILVASPWWIYQLWAFLAPGLTGKEKRYTVGFVAVGVPLFLAGVVVAWSVLPRAAVLLGGAIPDQATNLITASSYVTFVTQFLVVFGVAFLLPLLMVLLTAAGVVSGRTWIKTWRWSILGIFVFSALATPAPDAVSMFLMALPLLALYGGALGVALLLDRRRREPEIGDDDEKPTQP